MRLCLYVCACGLRKTFEKSRYFRLLCIRLFFLPSFRSSSSVFVVLVVAVDDVSVFGFYFGSTNGIFRILTSLFTFISTIYLYAAIQTFARLNGLLSMCIAVCGLGTFFIFFSLKPVRVLSIYFYFDMALHVYFDFPFCEVANKQQQQQQRLVFFCAFSHHIALTRF